MEIRSNRLDTARRPFPAWDIEHPNRETIERVTPEAIKAGDVRASLTRHEHEALERAERAMAARDKLSLSETTLRLQAGLTPVDPPRSEHIAGLRALHQAGILNTDELIARAAFKLLSGE